MSADHKRRSARRLMVFHLVATIVWALLVVPTVIWWRNSILWVAMMSVWANLAAHFAAFQASRSEVRQDDRDADTSDDEEGRTP